MAPVMGCFLAMMVLSATRSQLGFTGHGPTDWVAAAASNQSYAAYLGASLHCEQNALQQDPIELTNTPRISNDSRPTPPRATNSVIR